MKPKRRYKKGKFCVYNEKLYREGLSRPDVYVDEMTVSIAYPMTEEAREKGLFFNAHTFLDWLFYGEWENKFLWIGRLLITWGWNGKKNTFSISWYKADYETQVWSIGDY